MQIASAFMELFDGSTSAYGTYDLRTSTTTPKGKVIAGKGGINYVYGKVTVEHWVDHLSGRRGLGIVPIRKADNCVKFGAIDVDVYDMPLQDLNAKIRKHKLPLVLCRTKSGGAHLYLFLLEWVKASVVQNKLREWAAMLGHGDAEIFPKQAQLLPDEKDSGSWINMPYYDMKATKRYGLDERGVALSALDFINYAANHRLTEVQMNDFKPVTVATDAFKDGPPCLQILAVDGVPEGSRNNGLFSMGVYARKIAAEGWEDLVRLYNKKYFKPPLSETEVEIVIKSLRKKDYTFLCKELPIRAHCDSATCRTRTHGIGARDIGMPRVGSSTILMTDPPIVYLDLEGDGLRLACSMEELQCSSKFQLRCMHDLHIMPAVMKREDWRAMISPILEMATVTNIPKEMTTGGQLEQHIEDFCLTRWAGKDRKDLLLGRPLTMGGRHYFKLKNLLQYLERQKFKYEENKVVAYLKSLDAQEVRWNIEGVQWRGLSIKQVATPPSPDHKLEAPITNEQPL